ncbi:MAG: sulfurtransferase [Rhodospirillaceae bacterium]|nr:sulfurtransferase [Rhodospirillaceae bacterium]HAA92722.1 rhodanese-like domain-containing protein [Rhodospirillaceae bacterium]|tara:strand:+ start:338 stop:658 length:321 start_codon:yes stop_codon:yes gene_type:complete
MASEFISPETAKDWLESEEAVLVDVREAQEHTMARIEGATLISLSAFDPEQIPDHDGKKLIFHCASGVRCGMAAEQMISAGHQDTIYRLQGGIQAWHEAGYPVVFG